jgi:LytS/YehU family sensor histidine kinase
VQNEKEKSVDLLTRLADFMRSSLYDGEQDSITMVQEIALLHNYTEIERIRFDDNAAASVKLINNDPNYEVPPFIFLPFVENVFKHGASQTTENIFIDIELVNDKEHLTLKTKNTYIAGQALQGGIGLQNVRKRLDYYFPGRYTLDIEKSERFYMVMLTICK